MSNLKVGIIVFLGTNCEQDTKRACDFFDWDTEYIWQEDKIEKHYDLIFIPGGFSYGDHISSGRIAKFSPAIKSLPVGKSLIVGICNGFQILCESKLLPGALIENQNMKFISKISEISFQNELIQLPIAHHQGNYTCENVDKSQILMTYKNNENGSAENGSDFNIAGLYDRKNKIIGMMPHPERAIYEELGLTDGRKVLSSLSSKFDGLITEKEFEYVTKELGREPNAFELYLFSATYSEHCSYKHSKDLLKLLPRDGSIFADENAGGIEIGDHAILFKMESHNHPCAVEPYNGAATGIGGIVRDVLAMNARPIALCNSLKFGKESKRIKEGVVKGISDYGNCIGVPTVSTEVLLDDCFSENPLVNVVAIGIAKKSDILTSNTAKSGLKLMLVGSATMRDGMGGAAFASKKLSDEPNEDKISIQIANAFMKKKLIEACLDIFAKKLVVSCQDCGAAGILSSTSEVAFKSGCGVEIDLNKIHIGDKSIKDFEIMLSETQERMLFVVEEEKINEIAQILKKFELEHSIIGETIADKKYVVKTQNKVLADLPSWLLVTPPKIELDFKNDVGLVVNENPTSFADGNCPEIYEQYDHTVGARTQFQPAISSLRDNELQNLQGLMERSNLKQAEPNFNSLWLYEENCFLGIYTFSAVIEQNSQVTPFNVVYESILLAAKSLQEKGFKPVGITNCLNFANPEISPTMYEFRESILAIKKVCEELKIPICSGNVSFYNEYSLGKIKNTPTFTMLGIKS